MRKIDRTKKSNIRCEHCKFYNRDRSVCQRNPQIYGSVNYWERRPCFVWPEVKEGV